MIFIKDSQNNFRAWKEKNHLKLYKSWKRSPLMTGMRFILLRTFFHSLLLLFTMSLFGYYWHGEICWNALLPDFIPYSFGGFVSMIITWRLHHKAFRKRFNEESNINLFVK